MKLVLLALMAALQGVLAASAVPEASEARKGVAPPSATPAAAVQFGEGGRVPRNLVLEENPPVLYKTADAAKASPVRKGSSESLPTTDGVGGENTNLPVPPSDNKTEPENGGDKSGADKGDGHKGGSSGDGSGSTGNKDNDAGTEGGHGAAFAFLLFVALGLFLFGTKRGKGILGSALASGRSVLARLNGGGRSQHGEYQDLEMTRANNLESLDPEILFGGDDSEHDDDVPYAPPAPKAARGAGRELALPPPQQHFDQKQQQLEQKHTQQQQQQHPAAARAPAAYDPSWDDGWNEGWEEDEK